MGLRVKPVRPRTRHAAPAARAHRRAKRLTPADDLQDADRLTGLQGVLSAGPRHFRLQFVIESDRAAPYVLRETNVWAADASAAATVAAAFPWPEGANRLRIVDAEGRVVLKRAKPRRG
jgi:hypothetical protein